MENIIEFFNIIEEKRKSDDNNFDAIIEDLYRQKDKLLVRLQNKLINLPNKESIDMYCLFLGQELGIRYRIFETNSLGKIQITEEEMNSFDNEYSEDDYDNLYEEKRGLLIKGSSDKTLSLIDFAYKFIDSVVYHFLIAGYNLVPSIEATFDRYISPISSWGGFTEEDADDNSEYRNLINRGRTTKSFQSVMTQSQLTTMFRFFRSKGIIDKNMTNIELARLIQMLSGGSQQKAREYLGGKNSVHINETIKTKQQATVIQDVLSDIIKIIEDEKKDIIE